MFMLSTISTLLRLKKTSEVNLLNLPGVQLVDVWMTPSGYQKEWKGLSKTKFPTHPLYGFYLWDSSIFLEFQLWHKCQPIHFLIFPKFPPDINFILTGLSICMRVLWAIQEWGGEKKAWIILFLYHIRKWNILRVWHMTYYYNLSKTDESTINFNGIGLDEVILVSKGRTIYSKELNNQIHWHTVTSLGGKK